MAEKLRYSDEELLEFKNIINEKLRLARRDFNSMMQQLMNADGNGVEDTSPTYKALEEGSASSRKRKLHKWPIVSRSSYRDLRLHLCALRTRHTVLTASPVSSSQRKDYASCHTQL